MIGGGKDGGNNISLPFVHDCSSVGATLIAYSLGEGGIRNVHIRVTHPLHTTMTDLK